MDKRAAGGGLTDGINRENSLCQISDGVRQGCPAMFVQNAIQRQRVGGRWEEREEGVAGNNL